MSNTYLITPTDRRTSPFRLTAKDHVHLGEQIAAHLAKHRQLERSGVYEAQISSERGAIRQGRRVVTFEIREETRRG